MNLSPERRHSGRARRGARQASSELQTGAPEHAPSERKDRPDLREGNDREYGKRSDRLCRDELPDPRHVMERRSTRQNVHVRRVWTRADRHVGRAQLIASYFEVDGTSRSTLQFLLKEISHIALARSRAAELRR
jgi:hypothetical protein